MQALLAALDGTTRAGTSSTDAEPAAPPPAVKERFERLLHDTARTLRSGRIAPPSERLPGGSNEPGGLSLENINPAEVELIAANVEAVEGIFSTGVGVDIENEQVCCFLRRALYHRVS